MPIGNLIAQYIRKYQALATHNEDVFSPTFHDSLFDATSDELPSFDDGFPPFYNASSEALSVVRSLDDDGTSIAIEVPRDGSWAVTGTFAGATGTIGIDEPSAIRWGVEKEFALGTWGGLGPAKTVLQYDGSMHTATATLQVGPVATRIGLAGTGGDCCGEPGCAHEAASAAASSDVTESGLNSRDHHKGPKRRITTDLAIFFPVFDSASQQQLEPAEGEPKPTPSLLRLALSGSNMPNVDPLLFGMNLNYGSRWRCAFSFPLYEAAIEEHDVFGWQTNVLDGQLLLSGIVAGHFTALPSYIRRRWMSPRGGLGRRRPSSDDSALELPLDVEVAFKWTVPTSLFGGKYLVPFPTVLKGGISTELTAGLGVEMKVVDVSMGLGIQWDRITEGSVKPTFGLAIEF